MGYGVCLADSFRLVDGQVVTDCRGFDRGLRESLVAAFRAVWLRDYFEYCVVRRHKGFQGGDGEVGRA